jgi:4a-hydroxytetrahydrobiopterin dehydratase
MENYADQKCIPCRGGEPPLSESEIDERLVHLPDWQIKEVDGVKRLERVVKRKDFKEALELTNRIGAIAEQEDHHPRIVTEWGRVEVQWWTHTIGGLHQNDFIMAAKTERLAVDQAP